jgi:hypothetical protein
MSLARDMSAFMEAGREQDACLEIGMNCYPRAALERSGWKGRSGTADASGTSLEGVGDSDDTGLLAAIIYATAQTYNAQLVTADLDFANLPGVIIP